MWWCAKYKHSGLWLVVLFFLSHIRGATSLFSKHLETFAWAGDSISGFRKVIFNFEKCSYNQLTVVGGEKTVLSETLFCLRSRDGHLTYTTSFILHNCLVSESLLCVLQMWKLSLREVRWLSTKRWRLDLNWGLPSPDACSFHYTLLPAVQTHSFLLFSMCFQYLQCDFN